MYSTNGAGVVKGKAESLRSEVEATSANIVTIQETHSLSKGQVKMPRGFVIFEAIRKAKHGGTLCAIREELSPKLVEEYNEPFELLVVEVEVNEKSIRIITGCGPQENWEEAKRRPFFIALEAELVKAEIAGKSVIIEMDSNSKLGSQYIPNDPHPMSPNGRLLADIIERHVLVVANGEENCSGLVTRQRTTSQRTEKSCIDLLIFSSDMKNHFKTLVIDEARKHVLARVKNTKNGPVKKESDHNALIAEFDCKVKDPTVMKKDEAYNLKNSECQKKFHQYTSNTKMLSSIFDSKDDLDILTLRFIKKLDGCIKMNFRKVRVNNHKETEEEKLYKKMRELKDRNDKDGQEAIEEVVAAIAKVAETKYTKVMDELNRMKPEEGKIDAQKFWKIKKRLFPKSMDPPSVMIDKDGNILTDDKAIENRALEVYKERLEPNKMEEHLKAYEHTNNKLCEARLKLTKLNKTDPWSIEDLDEALKDLGNNKSRDSLEYANELFKEGVAGSDLKLATLKLMNQIKDKQQYPKALEQCNITSLYKHKGSRKDFNNYRGVFRVTVFRSILDRLIYNDNYYTIDDHLTDGNVGARKQRNIRDNIFVLGAVTNSVINGGEDPVQIQVQDAIKCFDKLWLEETTNALYEAGLKSDMLNLLYLENQNAKVAIKINSYLTRRINISKVELQGSVWGSLKCTTAMDQLNKIILPQNEITYKYRGDTNIQIGHGGRQSGNLKMWYQLCFKELYY